MPWVFQFIGSEFYNTVDKTFPLPLLLKEGYVWFHGRSLLLNGISGSRLRPILDRSGEADAAFGLRLLLSQHQPRRIHPKRDYMIAESCLFHTNQYCEACAHKRTPWRFAHPERGANPSRLVSASLYPSLLLAYQLEPSFDRDCSSLLGSFSMTRDPSQHRQRSLDSSRPGRLGSKLIVAYLTPFLLLGR